MGQMMATKPVPAAYDEDTPRGFAFALAAYLLWGFLPFYMKAVGHIPALEVVAHRVVWSVPIAAVVLIWLGRTQDIRAAFRISADHGHGADYCGADHCELEHLCLVDRCRPGNRDCARLLYQSSVFDFPGAVLLKESLDGRQKAAIALAIVAVALLAYESGGVPWVSVGLALSWGFYAFFKKSLPVGPNQGFFLEVLILTPPAIGFILYTQMAGTGHFGSTGMVDVMLLLGCGLVTAVPLMIYANGAKLLRLSTIGIMQYIAPTMIFVIAVFVFKEPFGPYKMAAFVLIWTALAIYSSSLLRSRKARRAAAFTSV
jgi:chloramphenicol-sensitive protein RarD